MSTVWPYVAAIVPTILVATLFYFIVKSMIEGDRRERIAQAKFEREQDARNRAVDNRTTAEPRATVEPSATPATPATPATAEPPAPPAAGETSGNSSTPH